MYAIGANAIMGYHVSSRFVWIYIISFILLLLSPVINDCGGGTFTWQMFNIGINVFTDVVSP